MTADEMLDLPEATLVLCKDGEGGILIGWPFASRAEALVQVPGEPEARRIHPSALRLQGRGLIEDGADVEAFARKVATV